MDKKKDNRTKRSLATERFAKRKVIYCTSKERKKGSREKEEREGFTHTKANVYKESEAMYR